MDHKCKRKMQIYKLLKDNIENLGDLEYGIYFLDAIPEALSMKEIIDNLFFINIQKLLCKTFCQEHRRTNNRGIKYFQAHI